VEHHQKEGISWMNMSEFDFLALKIEIIIELSNYLHKILQRINSFELVQSPQMTIFQYKIYDHETVRKESQALVVLPLFAFAF